MGSNSDSGLDRSVKHVVLGMTGGIGVVKTPQIVSLLQSAGYSVRAVMTHGAQELASAGAFEALTRAPVATEVFTHECPSEIQHISWAEWADAALIAPATANTISKMACGIADNLLTTMMLAMTCPIMVVPAMNTNMYLNEAVQANLQILRKRGIHVMEPASGRLACGVVGPGRLPEPPDIVREFLALLNPDRSLEGVRVLVTAGPTRESIDAVRYISNRSSGKMGYALAAAARDMGAQVTLVSGPVSLPAPSDVEVIHVTTALEMRNAVLEAAPEEQIIIGCAAVSDYMLKEPEQEKLPKTPELSLRLMPTPDIMAELGHDKSCFLVGFAAQTHDVLRYAADKMKAKNMDMIVANDVSNREIGMESDDNEVTILGSTGLCRKINRAPKAVVARDIMRVVAAEYRDWEKVVRGAG